MAKKCWDLNWVDCAGNPGQAYVCADDMAYVSTGGTCGLGYFSSASAGFDAGNASERSGTFVQVALANCSNACAGGEEPGGSTTDKGKTSNDPVRLTGTTDTSGSGLSNTNTKSAKSLTPVDSQSGRYNEYKPSEPSVSAAELNLSAGFFAGQSVAIQENFTIVLNLANPLLVTAALLDRAYPIFLAGFYQVKRFQSNIAIAEEGQIRVVKGEGATYQATLFHDRQVTLLPAKTDSKAGSYLSLDPCNFEAYADGTATEVGGVVALPNYKLTGQDPAFKGKFVIPQVDSSQIAIDYYYGTVGLYLLPGWNLNTVYQQVAYRSGGILTTSEVQVDTSPTCRQGSGV